MFGNKRRSELEHIQRNAQGEYIYTGVLYTYRGIYPRGRAIALLWLVHVCGFAALVVAGTISVPGMNGHWYVILPYTAAIILTMSALWSLGQLTAAGEPIREYVADTACKRLPQRDTLTVIAAALTFIGEGVYLILHGENTLQSVIYLILILLAGGMFFLGRRVMSRMSWEKQ